MMPVPERTMTTGTGTIISTDIARTLDTSMNLTMAIEISLSPTFYL
jgi:hypothetical protein